MAETDRTQTGQTDETAEDIRDPRTSKDTGNLNKQETRKIPGRTEMEMAEISKVAGEASGTANTEKKNSASEKKKTEKTDGEKNQLSVSEEPPERPENRFEFLKGMLFGILISAICVLAVYLVLHGTVGKAKGKGEGASVLKSGSLRHKMTQIADKIQDNFYYDVDEDRLEACLLKGMIIGLDDRYANYYTEEELDSIVDFSKGVYYGIGISLLQDEESGAMRIAGIYEGSPADEAGLETGDELLQVNDTKIEDLDLASVVALIKEQSGELTVTVRRDGQEQTFSLKAATVEIPTVTSQMMEGQTGYIRILEFDTVTVEQFQEACQELEAQNMEKLIVDVRDNPGGNLDSVCEILRGLLPEGLIVYTSDKDGEIEEYRCDGTQEWTKPLAVLVNGNSASASEIFAGAVQDYGIGTVVGTQTYGKGVVQRTFLLDDGSALKITTEKYYTPMGRDIDDEGILPDVTVEAGEDQAEDTQLDAALELLNSAAETEAISDVK